MYAHAVKRSNSEFEFHAAMHGMELNKEAAVQTDSTEKERPKTKIVKTDQQSLLFGDPETDYNHLTEEEKQKKTEKMMTHFRMSMSKSHLGD